MNNSNSTLFPISIIIYFNKRWVKLSLIIKIRRATELSFQDNTTHNNYITKITEQIYKAHQLETEK